MVWLLVLYLPAFAAFFIVARSTGLMAPDSLLVVFNSIALIGTCIIADPAHPIEWKYAWLVLGLTTLLTIIVVVRRIASFPRTRARPIAAPTRITGRLLALFAFSFAVSLGYYIAIGDVTLVSALTSGGQYDAATSRLESYSGSRYFFPGYVNQFKNAVLPVLAAVLVHSIWVKRLFLKVPLTLLIAVSTFIMVAGTGQRAPTVIAVLVIFSAMLVGRLLSPGRMLALGLSFFVLFAIQTVVLRRQAAQLEAAGGVWAQTTVFGEALWSRVVLENPASGIHAFYYTEGLPTQYGREWIVDIMGVLPGNRGSDLANRVFEMLYGTPRGTAPASLWGGMYYNFGLVGSVIVTTLIALAFTWLARWLILHANADDRPTFLSCLSIAGMAISAGAWVAGSPLTILNQCFFAYLALFLLRHKLTGPNGQEHRVRIRGSRAAKPFTSL